MVVKASKEQKELVFKEFTSGENSKYWNAKRKKFNAVQLGKTACVSEITVRRWYKEYLAQPKDDKVSDNGSMVGKLPTMEAKKKYALYIFNLGNNSRYWNFSDNQTNLNALSKAIGVSDWSVRYWYAQWQLDHNTNLAYAQLSPEELKANKEEYFKELANGTTETTFKTMAKYHITSQVLKKWNIEYGAKGLRGVGRLDVTDKSSIQNDAKPQDQPKQDLKPFVKHATDSLPEKVAPNNIEPEKQPEKSPIEVVDSFFDNFTNYINRLKNAERERDTYKAKCEKWSKQVIDLQNALINRD